MVVGPLCVEWRHASRISKRAVQGCCFTKGRYVSASNDPCKSSHFPGSFHYYDVVVKKMASDGTKGCSAAAITAECTTPCGPGEATSPSGKCADCPAGRFQTKTNFEGAECSARSQCGAGQYLSAAGTASKDTTCSTCPSDAFQDAQTHTKTSCTAHTRCACGQYSDGASSTRDAICVDVSTSTATTTTTTATSATATATLDPCNIHACALQCDDECGWSRDEARCRTGLGTSKAERAERLGKCLPPSAIFSTAPSAASAKEESPRLAIVSTTLPAASEKGGSANDNQGSNSCASIVVGYIVLAIGLLLALASAGVFYKARELHKQAMLARGNPRRSGEGRRRNHRPHQAEPQHREDDVADDSEYYAAVNTVERVDNLPPLPAIPGGDQGMDSYSSVKLRSGHQTYTAADSVPHEHVAKGGNVVVNDAFDLDI